MRADPRLRFAVRALVVAGVLFAVWPWVSSAYCAIVSWTGSNLRYLAGADGIELLAEKDSYALVPIIALIGASQGYPARRRAGYILAAVLSFILVGTLTVAFDLVSPPAAGRNTGADLVFALLDVAVPVAVLVLFLGSDPSRLFYSEPAKPRVSATCPLCRQRQADVAGHVRSVHGLAAMNDARVRRILKATH